MVMYWFFVLSLIVTSAHTKCVKSCGKNEVLISCYPCRPLNCGDPQPGACPLFCVEPGECYCKEGYLRKNGTCVPEQDCCSKNEVFLQCEPCAAISCGQTPPEVCIAICRNPGCYCKDGYLRKNGKCVPVSQC